MEQTIHTQRIRWNNAYTVRFFVLLCPRQSSLTNVIFVGNKRHGRIEQTKVARTSRSKPPTKKAEAYQHHVFGVRLANGLEQRGALYTDSDHSIEHYQGEVEYQPEGLPWQCVSNTQYLKV